MLDVGTGAGLPGIVLAMADPERHFTLLDANAKKIRFCRQVCIELSLANVDIAHARIEEYTSSVEFSTIVARAYSTVHKLLTQGGHLHASGPRVLVMKGPKVMSELERNGLIRDNVRIELLPRARSRSETPLSHRGCSPQPRGISV